MRKRILIIAGIAALVIAATALAIGHGFQERREHGKGPGHGDMVEHMSRELSLNDAQKQQVKAIFDATQSTAEGIHAKLEETHKQLEAATANGQFDEGQVRNLANQQAQLESDMLVEHLRAKSKVYAILTPEQRTKADGMMKEHGGPGRGFGGPGRHGPPPPPGF
jgi:Spy/CpxP family protein refolding chaperone